VRGVTVGAYESQPSGGRRKGPGGVWQVWRDGGWVDEAVAGPPRAVEHDGSGPVTRKARREPTARQREVWEAVAEHGTQVAAAKALGLSQGGVQGSLKGYMAAMGIQGPMPGMLYPRGRGRRAEPSSRPVNGGSDHASVMHLAPEPSPESSSRPVEAVPPSDAPAGLEERLALVEAGFAHFDREDELPHSIYLHGYRVGWMAAVLRLARGGHVLQSSYPDAAALALAPPDAPEYPG
jgi:hypothetical protein